MVTYFGPIASNHAEKRVLSHHNLAYACTAEGKVLFDKLDIQLVEA
jgi:hypothetical protein